MNKTEERIKEIVRQLASEFFARESSGKSLITVTHVDMHSKSSNIKILFSVFPASEEANALEFINRRLSDFREYVKKHSKLMRLPFFDAEIDVGEKNRQRIDEIEKTV